MVTKKSNRPFQYFIDGPKRHLNTPPHTFRHVSDGPTKGPGALLNLITQFIFGSSQLLRISCIK